MPCIRHGQAWSCRLRQRPAFRDDDRSSHTVQIRQSRTHAYLIHLDDRRASLFRVCSQFAWAQPRPYFSTVASLVDSLHPCYLVISPPPLIRNYPFSTAQKRLDRRKERPDVRHGQTTTYLQLMLKTRAYSQHARLPHFGIDNLMTVRTFRLGTVFEGQRVPGFFVSKRRETLQPPRATNSRSCLLQSSESSSCHWTRPASVTCLHEQARMVALVAEWSSASEAAEFLASSIRSTCLKPVWPLLADLLTHSPCLWA